MRAYVLLLLATVGCGNSFEKYSHVHSLSVLAIKAEPPEIAPGEQAVLSALVDDPLGRTITYQWALCSLAPPLGQGVDINEACLAPLPSENLLSLGTDATAQVVMPNVKPTDLGLPDATDGFYIPVRLDVHAGSDVVMAIYRVRYALGGPRNHNPQLAPIEIVESDDSTAPLTDDQVVHVGDSIKLRNAFVPGSSETYFVLDPQTQQPISKDEILRTSWFTTGGSFTEEHTGADRPDTTWQVGPLLPNAPTQDRVDLWLVVRDDRGGTDFVSHRLPLAR